MELNSCLYQTQIMHHRLKPKEHRFAYSFFSFYLDLDEIDAVAHKLLLFSRNKFNLYSFYDKDHMDVQTSLVKQKVLGYLHQNGVHLENGRIMLLTYLRTLGYVFNPVSFYYCFDQGETPVCVIAQIGNTFGEIKPFLIRSDRLTGGRFKDQKDKFYYISPFTKLDDQLDFKLSIPDERFKIHIDTSRDKKKLIMTAMTGQRQAVTDRNLSWLTLKFPFVTLKVTTLIHWHALLLWLKKIPYQGKESNPHLQKEVYRAWSQDTEHPENWVGNKQA